MNLQQIYKIFSESSGVSIDSRKIRANQLFIALRGDRLDGNEYVENAMGQSHFYAIGEKTFYHPKYIEVNDALQTLQDLARFHRQQIGLRYLIAITGSNGKTTTKELIQRVLSAKFSTVATIGNLNNHIGLPLSLLTIDRDHELAIIEMGASQPGNILELCKIAKPNYSVITNIGRAHLEELGSIEGVKKEKVSLYHYTLSRGGKIFKDPNESSLHFYNSPSEQTIQSTYPQIDLIENTPYLILNIRSPSGRELTLHTRMTGEYNIANIRNAWAIGKYFGVEEELISSAISSYEPSDNRSELFSIGKTQIFLDAYNANPESMKSSLLSFSHVVADRKAVFLGDMMELGQGEMAMHQEVLDMLAEFPSIDVYLIGKVFAKCRKGSNVIAHFGDVAEAFSEFEKVRTETDAILIKGSRSVGLEALVQNFRQQNA